MNLLEIAFTLYVILGVILCAKYFKVSSNEDLSNGEKILGILFFPSFMLFVGYIITTDAVKSVKRLITENTLHENFIGFKSWLAKRD